MGLVDLYIFMGQCPAQNHPTGEFFMFSKFLIFRELPCQELRFLTNGPYAS